MRVTHVGGYHLENYKPFGPVVVRANLRTFVRKFASDSLVPILSLLLMAQGSSKLNKSAPKRVNKQATNPKKGQRTIPPKKRALVAQAAKKKASDPDGIACGYTMLTLHRNYLQNSRVVSKNRLLRWPPPGS